MGLQSQAPRGNQALPIGGALIFQILWEESHLIECQMLFSLAIECAWVGTPRCTKTGGECLDYQEYLADLILQYLPKYFTDEEMEEMSNRPIKDKAGNIVSYGIPLIGPNGIRRQLGEIDYEFYARAYFPDFCNLPPCQFHHEQYEEMKRIEKKGGGETVITAAPREAAKSTLWNMVYPTHNAVYRKKHYIVMVSDSSDQAVDDLKQVKTAIEENEYILEDFGRLQGKTIWRTDAILLKNDVLIVAKGSGKKIRGIKHKQYRPDLVILDDIENDENVQSPDQRKKLMNWFNKVVMNAGSKKTDIVVIGTILHYDSLLNNLLNKPGYRTRKYKAVIEDNDSPLWLDWEKIYVDLSKSKYIDPVTGEKGNLKEAREFFEAHREEMTTGSVVIWPEAKDLYFYKRKLIDLGPAAYNSEFQNEPIDPDSSWITPDDFQYYDGPHGTGLPELSKCVIKGALDPSMGKNDKSDLSSICTMARDFNGYLYVVESDARRRSPDEQILDILAKHERFHYQEFYIEDVAFQAYLASNMQKESAKRGTYVNVVTEPKPKGDKHSRIKAQLQPMIKNGYIKFSVNQRSLVDGLIYLGSVKYDDEPESLQQVAALFSQFETEFVHTMMPNIHGIEVNW